MEKKYLVRFIKEGRRGVYKVLVEMYAGLITTVGVNMALELITEDLEKESSEKIVLNYSSLAHAVKKYKTNTKTNLKSESKLEKFNFLDAHEIAEKQLTPGKFKLPQVDADKSRQSKSKAN